MKYIFPELLHKSLLALSAYASDAEDSDDVRFKKITVIIAALAATILYFVYGLVYYWFNERAAAIVTLGMSVLFALAFASYWKVELSASRRIR